MGNETIEYTNKTKPKLYAVIIVVEQVINPF